MRYSGKYNKVFVALLILLIGCRDPFNPSLRKETVSILVVDGFMNGTNQSVVVKLSRAVSLSSKDSPPAETGATVSVEDEDGVITQLTEVNGGDYEVPSLNIDVSKKYRLNIQTSNSSEYQSDYTELRQSPPIDSVTWQAGSDGVTIHVDTHDPLNSTKYYQWTYTETYQYTAKYQSTLEIVGGQVISRPPDESIYTCWGSTPSSSILINSTVHLSSDNVQNFPLTVVEVGSYKFSKLYSILVQQRALTSDAYDYWEQLKKTTESLGGLFDPLPSQVTGNIHNVTNSTEPVLGYFSGGTIQEKRIFISFYDLPRNLEYVTSDNEDCEIDSIKINAIGNAGSGTLLIGSYGTGPAGYLSSSYSCLDCRSKGGVNVKPDFWP